MNNAEGLNINDLEVSLVDTLVSERLTETIGDIYEAFLDAELTDGIIKNVPFFNVLYKAGKIALTIKDRIFAKKVLRFLKAIKNTTVEERAKFINELEIESGQKAGEVLIMIIERLDNMEKPKIIANLLIAKIKGNISIESFLRYSHAIDKVFFHDLKKLELFRTTSQGKGIYIAGTAESLYSLGLLKFTNRVEAKDTTLFNKAIFSKNTDRYRINKMGEDLLKYGIYGEVN